MNSINNNVPSNKSQSSQPVEQLTALYSQIAAAGYGPDHPWCMALAGVIASEDDTPRLGGCSVESDLVRQQAYEIEERIGKVALLIEETMEKIDAMECKSPDQRRAVKAATTFIQSAMENVEAVRIANAANLASRAPISQGKQLHRAVEANDLSEAYADLTKESLLLKSYRMADERGKATVLEYAVSVSEDWPGPTANEVSEVEKLVIAFDAVDTQRKAEVLAFLERLAPLFPA